MTPCVDGDITIAEQVKCLIFLAHYAIVIFYMVRGSGGMPKFQPLQTKLSVYWIGIQSKLWFQIETTKLFYCKKKHLNNEKQFPENRGEKDSCKQMTLKELMALEWKLLLDKFKASKCSTSEIGESKCFSKSDISSQLSFLWDSGFFRYMIGLVYRVMQILNLGFSLGNQGFFLVQECFLTNLDIGLNFVVTQAQASAVVFIFRKCVYIVSIL